jgi:hypothetical protein
MPKSKGLSFLQGNRPFERNRHVAPVERMQDIQPPGKRHVSWYSGSAEVGVESLTSAYFNGTVFLPQERDVRGETGVSAD